MNRRSFHKASGITIAGIFFSSGIIHFLQSCKSSTIEGNTFFTIPEKDLIAEMAELIIPETDIPGAHSLGLGPVIEAVIINNYESEDQKNVKKGLHNIIQYVANNFGKSFPELTTDEKALVMDYLVKDSRKSKPIYKKHIFSFIKGLTMITYFTSQNICTEVLLYDPIPGEFQGNIPYNQVNGQWALKDGQ